MHIHTRCYTATYAAADNVDNGKGGDDLTMVMTTGEYANAGRGRDCPGAGCGSGGAGEKVGYLNFTAPKMNGRRSGQRS